MDAITIMDRFNDLKSTMQEYLGVNDVDIDIKIHGLRNNLNTDVISKFSALGNISFDAAFKDNGETFAWLKKKLSPCSGITLFFKDYAEAQEYGYKLPETEETK